MWAPAIWHPWMASLSKRLKTLTLTSIWYRRETMETNSCRADHRRARTWEHQSQAAIWMPTRASWHIECLQSIAREKAHGSMNQSHDHRITVSSRKRGWGAKINVVREMLLQKLSCVASSWPPIRSSWSSPTSPWSVILTPWPQKSHRHHIWSQAEPNHQHQGKPSSPKCKAVPSSTSPNPYLKCSMNPTIRRYRSTSKAKSHKTHLHQIKGYRSTTTAATT